MDTFAAFVSSLTLDDPQGNVTSIKNAIISRLEALGKGISVESTDFFNHTYAPDLILHWSGETSVRAVYLRTSDNPEYIREDVSTLSEGNPIIVPLSTLRGNGGTEALKAESAMASTLVATPSTLSQFAEGQAGSPVLELLSKAVIQGGRGLVDEDRARSVSTTVVEGFAAAQHADVEPTREAILTTEALLDQSRAAHFTRLLHAVWVGAGASAATFPGVDGITDQLDSVELELLLSVATATDAEFWRRIASSVTLELLCETEISVDSDSLQMLMRAGLDRFRAKSLRLTESTTRSEERAASRWFTHSGLLGLRTADYTSYFSPGPISSFGSVEESQASAVALHELIHRATAATVDVEEVAIEAENGRRITYRSPTDSRIWTDKVLYNLAQSLGDRSSVISATTPLGAGDRHLKCDLVSLTAHGRTGAKFYVEEFVRYAIPILRSLSGRERKELRNLLDEAN